MCAELGNWRGKISTGVEGLMVKTEAEKSSMLLSAIKRRRRGAEGTGGVW